MDSILSGVLDGFKTIILSASQVSTGLFYTFSFDWFGKTYSFSLFSVLGISTLLLILVISIVKFINPLS